jgi:hypothetical protein
MNRFAEATDTRLVEHLEQLRRAVQDFEERARVQKTALEREDRFSQSEPLYQRLTSIRDHLRADLRSAQNELDRRERDRSARPAWSLRSAFAALLGVRV